MQMHSGARANRERAPRWLRTVLTGLWNHYGLIQQEVIIKPYQPSSVTETIWVLNVRSNKVMDRLPGAMSSQ